MEFEKGMPDEHTTTLTETCDIRSPRNDFLYFVYLGLTGHKTFKVERSLSKITPSRANRSGCSYSFFVLMFNISKIVEQIASRNVAFDN